MLHLLRRNPVVAVVGARQVGKSTLARQIATRMKGTTTFFDLEHPADLRLLDEPSRVLEPARGLVVLDEVQRRPELFPVLRVLADRPRGAKFLVLGSAAPELLRQSSESLAGRIAYHHLGGLSLSEVGPAKLNRLWLRGGFPRSFTARSDADAAQWRLDFVRTFLERDLPQLGVRTPETTLRRFWSMLAHVHGQTLNWSELGRSMGVADSTVRGYLDALTGTFVVRQLQPWFENISKRQVKAPKVFIGDSGLLHTLLDVNTRAELDVHPKVGASWEGFCISEVVKRLGARPDQCFFWATHAGAELDLLVVAGGKRRGFEVKLTDAPRVTPSMRVALEDLKLDSLDVIHAGRETTPLAARIRAVSAGRLVDDLKPHR
ncbi:MAG: ATP-binding protein [Myxococcaceae bacterium]